MSELDHAASAALIEQGVEASRIELKRRARLRFAGSDTTLEIDVADLDRMQSDFTEFHRQRFGYVDEAGEIILDTLIVEAVAHTGSEAAFSQPPGSGAQPRDVGHWQVYSRAGISSDQTIEGPALITDPSSVTVVELGWRAMRSEDGTLLLNRSTPAHRTHAIGTNADPVMLEIFNNLFMAIAEEMGVALQSTATSVNIKERLDFSCALFDAEGALIANAPHIPVHLGSMGESIRTIIDTRGGRRGRSRHPARRCVCAERSISRRHAFARHHGDRAGFLWR